MKHFLLRSIAVLSALVFVWPSAVAAQAAGGPVVKTVGTAKVVRPVQLMRLQIELSVQDKTAKDALAKLKDLEAAAKAKLVALGIDEKSISFESPVIGPPGGPEMQQRMRMMGRNTPKPTGPQPVGASASLKAEWPLKADDNEAMVLAAQDFQDKIKAANLNGPTKPLTPQEEEAREEAMGGGGDENAPAPGTPTYLYVARLSDEEHTKALADAFAKAKAEATLIASAAGAKLGPVQELSGQSMSRGMAEDANSYAYQRYMYMNGNQDPSGSDERESIRLSPGPITFQVMIEASFALGG